MSNEARMVLLTAQMCADVIGSLSDIRIKKGITRRQLAKACGVRPFTITWIENIKIFPRLDLLIKMAVALGVRLSITKEVE